MINMSFFYLQSDQSGSWTPLDLAIDANRPDVIELLIKKFHADLELEIGHGKTSLFTAVDTDNVPVTKQLLDNGACVNHRDWMGGTPLFLAVIKRQPVMVELLISLIRC